VAGKSSRSAQSAFGESPTSDLSIELGFHQMWSSALAPLRFAGVRVYDPETGRFLTPDPLGMGASGDPNDAVDPFRYAHNNPIAVRDSTGYLGITPPTPTTIIVDGIRVETFNVNAWGNGTIRVANQAAYIAGVRAGIMRDVVANWTREFNEALQSGMAALGMTDGATGQGPAASIGDQKRRGSIAPGLLKAFANIFRQRSTAAASSVGAEFKAHTQAAGEALNQARGGGPADGHFIDENGKIVWPISGADPSSNPYWMYVDGPDGRTQVGANTREILANFFDENPQYKAASRIFEAGDVLELEVEGKRMSGSGIVRFGSGLMNAVGGAISEAYNFMIHDNFGAWLTMGRSYLGYSGTFVPKSGFWNATNSYMNNGHSYPGAIFNVVTDGMFYGTFGALLGIDEASKDGDWYSVGQHTFAFGATVGSAALGGMRAGMTTPTTRSALLGRIAIESYEATTMMMPRRGRTVVESNATEVQRIMTNPLVLRDAAGKPKGVFFGPEAMDVAAKVSKWMDDGILKDSLHIGGVHADGRTGFLIKLGDTRYLIVSATQLARAVNKAVPGTSLTYDHLLACCAARPGGGAGLFARVRSRMVFSYDEVVGINYFGRYLTEAIGEPPLPAQYMTLFDVSGEQIAIAPFQGMRSTGAPVP